MANELLIAVLAAGASRRLGRPKQLVELDGEPLVRRACQTAIEAAVGPVVVVLGCRREEIAQVVQDVSVGVVFNDAWDEGMASSVRAATRAASDAGVAALLLLHADQYAVTRDDLVRLRDAWRASPGSACLSRDGDHLGPPAVLPAAMFPRMLTLVGDTGPRAILRGDASVVEVSMPSASRDVDRPSDLGMT
ncbi:MAG TPA: nucleotidyltransferase family protein [Tepidisphaeraceae bacterium]|nr:nucleotidyltransferase family protein [Tepidisphaeraceae bacterium]